MNKKTSRSLFSIINILNDCEYHDGNSIGEAIGISRTAVWKMIKKCEEYGIKIESIKNKGYRLSEPLYLLNEQSIKQSLHDKSINLEVFESIDSTNLYVKNNKTIPGIHACLAEEQTQGRGRLNRNWHSPFGKNIYLSLVYNFKKDISALQGLSIVISLAIQETLSDLGLPAKLMIKWPNDIYYHDQKISGSLLEIQAESNGYSRVIIGIGINVNMTKAYKKQIDQSWTSLQLILGHPIDRDLLCANLINHLIDTLATFESNGAQHYIDAWHHCDYLQNKTISLIAFENKITGVAKGIDAAGHLLIEDKQGQITAYSSGDSSLMKS